MRECDVLIRNDGVGSSNLSCGTNSGSDRSNWRPRSANSSPRPFSRRRADQSRSRRLGSSAVGPSALTVRTSARSRRRNPLPFSDAPGWAIDIEAGRWPLDQRVMAPRRVLERALPWPSIGPLVLRCRSAPMCRRPVQQAQPTPSWALSPQLSRAGK